MKYKLTPRWRGKNTPLSLTVHREDDSAAVASTNSIDHNEKKYNRSQFLVLAQSSYGKSMLLIGSVLMLITFPLQHPRHDFSLDQATILSNASLVTHDVTNTKTMADEQLVSEQVAIGEKAKYTFELAAQAVEPTTWVCGEMDMHKALDPITNQRPFFVFVHIYKTAGSTVREFFREYAKVCKKSLVLAGSCRGSGLLNECNIKSIMNAKRTKKVNSEVLRKRFDILGGHFRFGMADDVFTNTTSSNNGVRHFVFLRQPMERHISHILYQNKHQKHSVQDVAEYIKKHIRSSRKKGEYESSIFKYLLTPGQREMKYEREKSHEEIVAHKAKLSIDNLVRYNAIVGMTESYPESMQILEHAMGQSASSATKKDTVHDLFSRYSSGKDTARNVSKKKGITTSSVMNELMKDDDFMKIFREFVKYEQLIVDFAMDMHLKQYEAVRRLSGIE